MAGLDGRSCEFVKNQKAKEVVGDSMMGLPAALQAAVPLDPQTVKEGVAMELGRRLGVPPRFRRSPGKLRERVRSDLWGENL